MTFGNYVKDLIKELKENPDWKDKDIKFATGPTDELLEYLSIYEGDSNYIIFDIGNE